MPLCGNIDEHVLRSNMESYRSGHNGAVLKTVRAKAHRGSNPLLSAYPL